jgi:protein-L-isoaspartate(D-aspartate) O-methyltransferase
MTDFAAARRRMVDSQVRPADVTDLRLQAVMLELPRERFVPGRAADLAYLDRDVPVGEGQGEGDEGRRLLKPVVLAKLIQMAEIADGDRVLDVGCATGYSTVLMSRLAGTVVGLEEDPVLADQASVALAELAVGNAKVVVGPLTEGHAADGRYHVIILQGSVEVVPTALFDQLQDGGRLVCVLGRGPAGKAMLYRQIGGELSGRAIFDAAAPPLSGFAKPPAFVF